MIWAMSWISSGLRRGRQLGEGSGGGGRDEPLEEVLDGSFQRVERGRHTLPCRAEGEDCVESLSKRSARPLCVLPQKDANRTLNVFSSWTKCSGQGTLGTKSGTFSFSFPLPFFTPFPFPLGAAATFLLFPAGGTSNSSSSIAFESTLSALRLGVPASAVEVDAAVEATTSRSSSSSEEEGGRAAGVEVRSPPPRVA